MIKLVLLRHGESTWNLENRFTGWTDVDLSPKGIEEAHEAARLLKEGGYTFDVAFTSVLKRAIRTLWIALDDMDLMWLPVHRSWRLNERHYGAAGAQQDRAEVRRGAGPGLAPQLRGPAAAALAGRRAPSGPRPPLRLAFQGQLPLGESLKDTVARFLPHWQSTIAPAVRAGQRSSSRPRQRPAALVIPRRRLRPEIVA
jgi:2,3-bisphosphoglycerate-dependent phosphoglycerate mutase